MTYTSEKVLDVVRSVRNGSTNAYLEANADWLAMLTAFADLLAQIERAEPVAWQYRRTLYNSDEWTEWEDCSKEDADAIATGAVFDTWVESEVRALYTHPGADRLAEALRELLDASVKIADHFGINWREEAARNPGSPFAKAQRALAAHAQEPSVPDRAQK